MKKKGRGREKENSLTTTVIFWRLRFYFVNFYATYVLEVERIGLGSYLFVCLKSY